MCKLIFLLGSHVIKVYLVCFSWLITSYSLRILNSILPNTFSAIQRSIKCKARDQKQLIQIFPSPLLSWSQQLGHFPSLPLFHLSLSPLRLYLTNSLRVEVQLWIAALSNFFFIAALSLLCTNSVYQEANIYYSICYYYYKGNTILWCECEYQAGSHLFFPKLPF